MVLVRNKNHWNVSTQRNLRSWWKIILYRTTKFQTQKDYLRLATIFPYFHLVEVWKSPSFISLYHSNTTFINLGINCASASTSPKSLATHPPEDTSGYSICISKKRQFRHVFLARENDFRGLYTFFRGLNFIFANKLTCENDRKT